MKNFLSIVVFTILIALIISPNIAQAEKSEIEELYDTLQVGKAAFTATDDYSFLVNVKHFWKDTVSEKKIAVGVVRRLF